MKIKPATTMADLIRILHRFKVISFDKTDKLIDEIQVRVFEEEMRSNNRGSYKVDPSSPAHDPLDESARDPTH